MANIKFVGTGVFALPEEAVELQKLSDWANQAPVIKIGDSDMSAQAQRRYYNYMQEIVVDHGLPDSLYGYGLDPNTREFLRAEPSDVQSLQSYDQEEDVQPERITLASRLRNGAKGLMNNTVLFGEDLLAEAYDSFLFFGELSLDIKLMWTGSLSSIVGILVLAYGDAFAGTAQTARLTSCIGISFCILSTMLLAAALPIVLRSNYWWSLWGAYIVIMASAAIYLLRTYLGQLELGGNLPDNDWLGFFLIIGVSLNLTVGFKGLLEWSLEHIDIWGKYSGHSLAERFQRKLAQT